MTDLSKPTSMEDDKSFEASTLEELTWPARRAGWAVERHVIWPAADLLRYLGGSATWPFERLAWALRRRLVWPLQDGIDGFGRPVRAGLALTVALAALAAAGAGALSGTNPDSDPAPQAAPALAAVAPLPHPGPSGARIVPAAKVSGEPAIAGPILHGVAPQFAAVDTPAGSPAGPPAPGSGGAPEGGPTAANAATPGAPDEAPTPSATPSAEPGTPAPARVKPALDVSRQFADAFVLYEVGKGDSQVRETFKKTAAKPLVRALKKRPPRLPKGTEVPKARVLNVVPGPRHGTSLSVSVALVRLGAASELRLQLRHDEKAGWLVSDVRG